MGALLDQAMEQDNFEYALTQEQKAECFLLGVIKDEVRIDGIDYFEVRVGHCVYLLRKGADRG